MAGSALLAAANPNAVRSILPALFEVMGDIRAKWQAKAGACDLLGALAVGAPLQASWSLPEIVPRVTDCMVDLKEELKKASTDALVKCSASIGNKDIEPFVPTLVTCIARPEEVADCVHKLASTTFVQAVDARTLALLVPLLERGLVERSTPIRRKTCKIIINMAQLVDDPIDAVEFADRLLPGVTKTKDEMSNPEARSVAEEAFRILEKVRSERQARATERRATTAADVLPNLKEAFEASTGKAKLGDAADLLLEYAATLCAALIDLKDWEEDSWKSCVVPYIAPAHVTEVQAETAALAVLNKMERAAEEALAIVDDEPGEDLCKIEFSLAYGAKILLNNARLHLKRGQRYGLCGHNGCGKSTLLRAIANGQVDGFPPKDELRTVYVEHDIDASEADVPVVEFVYADPILQDASHPAHSRVEEVLATVGFTPALQAAPVKSLSGGWKMKLALARAMLMNADILLLDEPTNHLDVTNVKWLEDYLNSLTTVTSIIVSHDSGFLDHVCTGILHYEGRKLRKYLGNLSAFVAMKPEARTYYSLEAVVQKWKFPEPGFLEGITSKDRAILKMRGVNFKYPTAEQNVLNGVSLQVSLNSRVAVVGPNGAGKSTMIKLLTGELPPDSGTVWKHPNLRVAYVAQHAFHHIEQHLDKTPNQYIQWRYAIGEDREALERVDRTATEEEEKKMAEKVVVDGEKRVVEKLLSRRKLKKSYEYEVKWLNRSEADNSWLTRNELEALGFEKLVNELDAKEAAAAGMMARPLTAANIEKLLGDLGLDSEFATHSQMRGLSGGQKVKVVLGASCWMNPHIILLDEPTNYLDRESLAALAAALKDYGGGVVVISHSQEFCKEVCGETWTVGGGKLDITGQSAAALEAAKLEWKREEETTDAFGNTIKIKQSKKNLSRKELKARQKMKKAARERGEDVSDSEDEY